MTSGTARASVLRSRRSFLAIGLRTFLATLGLGSSLVGSICGCERQGSRRATSHGRSLRVGIKELRDHFPDLEFDDADAIAYLESYAQHVRPITHEVVQSYDFWSRFLLSTDLFLPNRPSGAPLRFVGFYDPYTNPCFNPLAVL